MLTELLYRIRPARPQAHLFEVEIEIPAVTAEQVTLSMPAWIPGSYMIRDFARHLLRLEAMTAAGHPLDCVKLDKQTWVCPSAGESFSVRYLVYAWELSVRTAHLDQTHAYFNGPNLLLCVHELRQRPCRIELLAPPESLGREWRVATSLQPDVVDQRGFGLYRAADYADLIDHPVEMGQFDEIGFVVEGVEHRMVIAGRQHADLDRLAADLPRICATHAAMFGELPIDRYLFLVTAVGDGYGGLEHRYSTSLICARDDLPHPRDTTLTDGYRRFLALCSHEYFHLWNVTRIRPQAFMDGGLDREVHTRTLWAFEGITSYYDELALVRSGCIDAKGYLGMLAATITRLMRTPGRAVQTLAESSFDAWTKLYKQDENAPNAIISYYVKGAIVALALDLTIRRDTHGACSLDDVMRALWERHGRSGLGVSEHGVERLASEVSGLDLDGFFAESLEGVADPDLAGLLAEVGVAMRLRPQAGPKDLGGCVDQLAPWSARPTLALRLRVGTGEALVQHVIRGGAAERAGIAPGDVIVAIEGLRVTAERLDTLVERTASASGISVHLFRRDELLELRAFPEPAQADTCDLMLVESVSDSVASARARWLTGGG
ncbi:MAG: M61 family peptidase [Sphingobacteriia bacterium]|nr:M61 family peptidase [Sphingobacteriia bacterium]NCC39053.1 M61 family peptidase [Gammaproteobacteria bacterium]